MLTIYWPLGFLYRLRRSLRRRRLWKPNGFLPLGTGLRVFLARFFFFSNQSLSSIPRAYKTLVRGVAVVYNPFSKVGGGGTSVFGILIVKTNTNININFELLPVFWFFKIFSLTHTRTKQASVNFSNSRTS